MRTGSVSVQFFIVFLASSAVSTHSRYSRETDLMKEPSSFKSGVGRDQCCKDQVVDVGCWGVKQGGKRGGEQEKGEGSEFTGLFFLFFFFPVVVGTFSKNVLKMVDRECPIKKREAAWAGAQTH